MCLFIFTVDRRAFILFDETDGREIDGFLVEVTYFFARASQSCSICRCVSPRCRFKIGSWHDSHYTIAARILGALCDAFWK